MKTKTKDTFWVSLRDLEMLSDVDQKAEKRFLKQIREALKKGLTVTIEKGTPRCEACDKQVALNGDGLCKRCAKMSKDSQ